MDVCFHRLAAKEYLKAVRWYAERSASVAERFVKAVDAAVLAIAADPYRWSKHDDHFRIVLVRKFPYILLFEIDDSDAIRVIAVAHTSRRPGYWKQRLKRP